MQFWDIASPLAYPLLLTLCCIMEGPPVLFTPTQMHGRPVSDECAKVREEEVLPGRLQPGSL
jgi:hypothetical protein